MPQNEPSNSARGTQTPSDWWKSRALAINNWWNGDPDERYWMEITDRPDLGVNLYAPKTDPYGHEAWSYTLVTYVRPGDIVFHWHRSLAGEPAIVGFSEAAGPLTSTSITWQARGTRGRARGLPTTGPAWELPLTGFTRLDPPVRRTEINSKRAAILELLSDLASGVRGPLYSPFQDYGHRELRAQQAYLVKFPAALTDLVLNRSQPSGQSVGSPELRTDRAQHSQGYQNDAAVRAALEQHALRMAREHYRRLGATEIVTLGKPYDLRVLVGGEERHVEVKGSVGMDLESVVLTQGEVDHARAWQPTDLFVVDSIVAARDSQGNIITSGGRSRSWESWTPTD